MIFLSVNFRLIWACQEDEGFSVLTENRIFVFNHRFVSYTHNTFKYIHTDWSNIQSRGNFRNQVFVLVGQ